MVYYGHHDNKKLWLRSNVIHKLTSGPCLVKLNYHMSNTILAATEAVGPWHNIRSTGLFHKGNPQKPRTEQMFWQWDYRDATRSEFP